MEELVRKYNPWWEGEEDVDLRKWRSMPVRWISKWINNVSLKSFSLNFIVGPRQVGKTTGVKLLIDKLTKKVNPYRVFYFNCDLALDSEYLRRVIDYYFSIRRSLNLSNVTCYLFLDEIGSVLGWWRVIKGYIDLGVFKNDVVTLTGSSTLRLRGEIELFPGRRGYGRDVTVLPLSFKEYAELHGIKVELTNDLRENIVRVSLYKEELMELFEKYLRSGGFPLSINGDPRAEEYFLLALQGELLRVNRNLHLVRGILSSLMRKAPSPLSYSTIGKDLGISYKTIQDYVEVLRNLYVLEVALFKEDKRVLWRKERKFFFMDPFIANALSHWVGEEYLESAIYEWVIQCHLHRKFESVYYYRNRYEIDCIAGDLKVEVKAGKPYRRYPKGVMVVDKEDIPVFLYALGT